MTSTLRYRAVVFDLDGTLVDSYEALEDAVTFALRSHDRSELTPGRIRELVGEGVERLMQKAFESHDVPQSAFEAFEGRYDLVCCEGSRILEEVETTLAQLGELDLPMGVCTNKPTPFSRKILEFLQLSRYFTAVVGPDAAGARKPDGRHVLATLEAIGAEAGETLFVGDMPIDIMAARNGGTDVAVIATGSSSAAALRAARPDHLLERGDELIRIIRPEAA